jgi:hypothetical protein
LHASTCSWKRRWCCLYARTQELHYFKQHPIECCGEIPLERCNITFGVVKSPDGKINGTQQVEGEIFSITPDKSQRLGHAKSGTMQMQSTNIASGWKIRSMRGSFKSHIRD